MKGIVKYAKKKNISVNKIIERAVTKLLDGKIKNELRHTFTLASNDKELFEMAERGLGDYLEQLKDMEK